MWWGKVLLGVQLKHSEAAWVMRQGGALAAGVMRWASLEEAPSKLRLEGSEGRSMWLPGGKESKKSKQQVQSPQEGDVHDVL